jgi:dipeptidyl-peptidase-4
VPVPVDAELSGLGLRVPELVQFKGPSGDMLHGAVLAPRTLEPGRRYPVAVMIYGGPYAQTVRNLWSSQQQLLWNHLADRNMVVFQLDNRGSAGRGRAFEEPLHRKLGFVELVDQIAGLDHLKTLPYVDSSRVGIYGHSYGGTMVLHALLRAPDRFQVGVSVSPVTDQRLYDTGYTERYMETPATNAEGYAVTDLTKLAPNLRGKLLLMHGMMDENVHFENSALMIDAFIAADKPIDLMVFPGERHAPGDRLPGRAPLRYVDAQPGAPFDNSRVRAFSGTPSQKLARSIRSLIRPARASSRLRATAMASSAAARWPVAWSASA